MNGSRLMPSPDGSVSAEMLRERFPRVAVVHEWLTIPGAASHAFCAGLVRPAIYVSEGTLRAGEGELRAVLAHEDEHRARLDPLRRLLARMVGDALRPPEAGISRRHVAVPVDAVERVVRRQRRSRHIQRIVGSDREVMPLGSYSLTFPSASVSTAITAKPGFLRSMRNA